MGGLCRARMSEAGLSLETATRRMGLVGVGEWIAALLIWAVTAERFEMSAEVRAGVAAMLEGVLVSGVGVVIAFWLWWWSWWSSKD